MKDTIINEFLNRVNRMDHPSDILKICNTIKYDDKTRDEKYIIKTPEELLKSKLGICYDIVELERSLFEKTNLEFKTFFSLENWPVQSSPTHTFLIFKNYDQKYYWFESAWKPNSGIHGPFRSYEQAVKQVESQLKKSWKSVYTKEYKKFDYTGMNINQFAKYIDTVGDQNQKYIEKSMTGFLHVFVLSNDNKELLLRKTKRESYYVLPDYTSEKVLTNSEIKNLLKKEYNVKSLYNHNILITNTVVDLSNYKEYKGKYKNIKIVFYTAKSNDTFNKSMDKQSFIQYLKTRLKEKNLQFLLKIIFEEEIKLLESNI